MVQTLFSMPSSLSLPYRRSSIPPLPSSFRNLNRSAVSSLGSPYGYHSTTATGSASEFSLRLDDSKLRAPNTSHGPIVASGVENPPLMPYLRTPAGALDLSTVLFRNRIIFIGQPIFSELAQRVISQLVTLASIDEDSDIMIYINSPGGSVYSVLGIYDCMSWIKPRVGTVCFGIASSHAALILAGGEKGMRYAMPNARIMIHQPQSSCGGHVLDVKRQVDESVYSRHKLDKMYAAFTGQPLEIIQEYTERDRFFSPAQAMDFGLIDGLMETEY
ncbi:ATP-dependent Clp protease proteolytic subunit 6, chloroplastic [Dionaea muscipula]